MDNNEKNLIDELEELNDNGKTEELLTDVSAELLNIKEAISGIENVDISNIEALLNKILNKEVNIKIPEVKIPQPTDYTLILDEILTTIEKPNPYLAELVEIIKKLPTDNKTEQVLEHLKAISERPLTDFKFDDTGRLKVNVDKVGGGVISFPIIKALSDGTQISKLADESGTTINPATLAKQDSQITLETTLNSLIESLQELTQRLAPLAGAMANTAQLRVVAGSTAVTGPITSANSIAEKAVAGAMYTMRVAKENLTAIQSNINNVSIT